MNECKSRMSEDLEGKCGNSDTTKVHISGSVPIINPPPQDQASSDIYNSQEIELVRTPEISEIKENPYLKSASIEVVREIIKRLEQRAQMAEVRGEVLEANVAREYHAKKEAEEALKAERHDKIGIFIRYIHRIYLHRLEESNRELAEEDLAKANARIKAHESNEFAYSLAMLGLSNKIEEQAALINEYAKRFGLPELLWKLKEAEENCAMKRRHCKTEDYNCISRLLEHHGAGKCPKTTGQRVVDFLEKIANPDTYYNIANAVCSALRKKK